MNRHAVVASSLAALAVFILGCMDQYHPEPYWQQFAQEREATSQPVPRLTETGELPPAGGEVVPVEQRYATLCAGCHGAQGAGDGPAGVALNPRPRNLRDPAWQASADDQRIFTVIKSGGAAIGVSNLMAPWGSVLSDAEIRAMVEYVRSMRD